MYNSIPVYIPVSKGLIIEDKMTFPPRKGGVLRLMIAELVYVPSLNMVSLNDPITPMTKEYPKEDSKTKISDFAIR